MRTIILLFAWLSLSASALSQNLVAYYPFNGNANDESGNAINPTYIGSGVTLTTDRFGNVNNAYNFNGATGSYIRTPADLLPTTNRTISFWFNVPDVSNRPGMLGYGGDGSCGTTLFMGLNIAGTATYFAQGHCNNNQAAYFYTTPPLNNWYHWVLTINGSAQKIYVNGQLKSTDNTFSGSTSVTGKDFSLGTIPFTNGIAPYTDVNVSYLTGKLDDVRIYDAAMSDAQVLQLYNNESSGLVAYYPFNGNANDESGNNINLTNSGSTLVNDRFGNLNSAYYFDGTAKMYCSDNDLLDLTNDFTISFWIKRSSSILYQFVMSKHLAGENGIGSWGIASYSGTDLSLEGTPFWGSGPPNPTSTTIPVNQWSQIAYTFNKVTNGWKCYFNGTLSSSGTMAFTIQNTTKDFMIGTCMAYSTYFTGSLDDIRIYNRVLSPNEILQLADVPVMPDLMAYLPMNGEANDKSGNSRNGTTYGGAALTTDKYDNNNSAYYFTNPECGISLASTSTLDFVGQPFAISAWVKYNNIPAADFAVVSKHNCGTPNGYLLGINNNSPRFYLCSGGSWSIISTTQTYNDNKWHHLMATYDGTGSQKLYVDGELKASASSVVFNTPGSGAPIIVGDANGNCGGGIFGASIDEVKIYGAVLDAAQVTALYKQSRGSGNAMQFDGLDDKINVGTGWDATNFTWEAWIKPDINNTNRNTIFSPEGNEGWYLQIQKENYPGGGFTGKIYFGIGSDYINIVQPYDGEWHHLAMTAQDVGSNFVLYKAYWDGVFIGQLSVVRVNNSGSTYYYLGIRNYLNDMPFMGNMDEVRYWNTVLTQEQISQWMNRKVTPDHPAYSNLLHYYNFDEKAINKTYDIRSSNPSVLINGPVYISSGASIGDKSNVVTGQFSNPGATVTLNSSTGESYTATMTSARNGGVAVYEILDIPENTSGILGLGSNNKYFGIFPIKGLMPPDMFINPQYTLTYNYTGNTFVSPFTEPTLQLFKRTDNSAPTWTNSGASLNTTTNTLTVSGQSTEYILGSSGFGLPVTLLNFRVEKINATTGKLTWQTSTELNNKGFEIQRSFDGNYFADIGFVNGAGNSDVLKEYSTVDVPGRTGRVYYRLKQIDFDGKSQFSPIASVLFDKQDLIKLYPNPAQQYVMIEGISNYNRVQLLDAAGKLLKDFIKDKQYQLNLNLTGLKSGVYIIRLVNGSATQTLKLVIE